jgi:hypothetical protein
MWRPRHDEGDKFLTEERRITSRDEYRHLICYGTYHAAIDQAQENIYGRDIFGYLFLSKGSGPLRSIRRNPKDAQSMLQRVRGKAHLPATLQVQNVAQDVGEQWVAERLVYFRFFDTQTSDRSVAKAQM